MLDIYSDYHVHTKYCNHAIGEVEEFVESGLRKGLNVIAFTDHFPVPEEFRSLYPSCFVTEEKWERYCEDVLKAKEKYKDKIKIILAAEVDYIPEAMDEIMLNLKKKGKNLELILGAVHFFNKICIDFNEDTFKYFVEAVTSEEEAFNLYYQRVKEMIELAFFHHIAHFDLIKKFGMKTIYNWGLIVELLRLIKDKNLVLQINTSGFDKLCAEQYPSMAVIKEAKNLGIEIVLGSDAHRPEEVARYFDRIEKLYSN